MATATLVALEILLATGVAMASHLHLWDSGTLQIKLALVALVLVLTVIHLRYPRTHALQGAIFVWQPGDRLARPGPGELGPARRRVRRSGRYTATSQRFGSAGARAVEPHAAWRRRPSSSRITIRRRSVRTRPSSRRVCSAFAAASREAPAQPASSSWEIGSVIAMPSGGRLAVAVGELHQPRRDPAQRLRRGELDPDPVGVAEAAHEVAQQRERDPGPLLQQGEEVGPGQGQGLDRLQRLGRARARLAVDHRELADQMAGPAEGEHDLAPVLGVDRDLGPAAEQDEDLRTRVRPCGSVSRPA